MATVEHPMFWFIAVTTKFCFWPLIHCGDHVNTSVLTSGSLRRSCQHLSYLLIRCGDHLSIIQKILPLSRVLAGDHVNSYCKKLQEKRPRSETCPAGDSGDNTTATTPTFDKWHAGWQPSRCASQRMYWMATRTNINTEHWQWACYNGATRMIWHLPTNRRWESFNASHFRFFTSSDSSHRMVVEPRGGF